MHGPVSSRYVLVVLVAGCSTIDGGGTSGGGGTDSIPPWSGDDDAGGADDTAGGFPNAPEDFDYCLPGPEGTEHFMGWQIACNASTATRKFVNPTDSSYVELQDLSGYFGAICCGGASWVTEADADCQVLCLEHVCEAARVQHVTWALDVSNDGMGGDCLDGPFEDCGFDFEECMTGVLHEQAAQPGNLFTYILQAECEAAHDQDLSPWSAQTDSWPWVEHPNDPANDPVPLCAPAPAPEPGPPERVPEMEVEEEPGTSVTLRWAVAGGPSGVEQSLEADVDLAYAINPCAGGDCIALSRLDLTLPDGVYQGLTLANPAHPRGVHRRGPTVGRWPLHAGCGSAPRELELRGGGRTGPLDRNQHRPGQRCGRATLRHHGLHQPVLRLR